MIRATDRIHHRMLATLTGVVVVAIIGFVALAMWMRQETNALARASAAQMVSNALDARQVTLQTLTEDYAFWDAMYNWVVTRDEAEIDANVGSSVYDGTYIDVIVVLDADATLQNGYIAEDAGFALDLVLSDVDDMRARLAETDLADPEGVTWFARHDTALLLLSAAYILPGDAAAVEGGFPILVMGVEFDEDVFSALSEQLLVNNIRPMTGEDTGAMSQHALYGFGDDTVITVHWDAQRPGDVLMSRAWPIIAGLAILLGLGTLLVARGTLRQARAYLREREIARTDHLTGVINRSGLDRLIETPEVSTSIAKGQAALIYLDLNEFKALNDTAGHHAGDLALQITAEKLTKSVRKSDYVARLGGDEFVCLIIDKNPARAAANIAERIIAHTRKKISFGHDNLAVRPSLGVAVAEPGSVWTDLLQDADAAMYRAKQARSTEAVFFNDAPIGAAA